VRRPRVPPHRCPATRAFSTGTFSWTAGPTGRRQRQRVPRPPAPSRASRRLHRSLRLRHRATRWFRPRPNRARPSPARRRPVRLPPPASSPRRPCNPRLRRVPPFALARLSTPLRRPQDRRLRCPRPLPSHRSEVSPRPPTRTPMTPSRWCAAIRFLLKPCARRSRPRPPSLHPGPPHPFPSGNGSPCRRRNRLRARSRPRPRPSQHGRPCLRCRRRPKRVHKRQPPPRRPLSRRPLKTAPEWCRGTRLQRDLRPLLR
jgi:hypothetical protein